VSSTGAPDGQLDATGLRLGIVAARWHADLTDELLTGALAEARALGASVGPGDVVRVPGAFEVPLAVQALAGTFRVDAVVALAVVARGGTPHFDYVCRSVTDGLTRVGLDSGVPVGFGVLTVDTLEQARERAGGAHGHKGREAARAALEAAATLAAIRKGS
jgi:6,7-dimethyl-8-ribityllumazine synthase